MLDHYVLSYYCRNIYLFHENHLICSMDVAEPLVQKYSAEDQLYQIALTLLPNVGSVTARNLVSYCGGVKDVFEASFAKLKKAPGIGDKTAREILGADVLGRAAEELRFIEKQGIETLFFFDERYPKRLRHCYDSPMLLYYKGTADLNQQRIVSIVGTRNASDYGKEVTQQLVEALAPLGVLVVSGMAYGIDIAAHKAALKNGLETVAVFGHGLDKVYPAHHRSTAESMLQQGGLLAEFTSGSRADRENFPKRNRIVAGMADATIVVETKLKGGSMITADLANGYNRDVFAVPGNIDAERSKGCNFLIRTLRAQLLDSPEELIAAMGWQLDQPKSKAVQREIFIDLPPEEQQLVDVLKETGGLAIDELTFKLKQPPSKVAGTLLSLELQGVVKSYPGKVYKLA